MFWRIQIIPQMRILLATQAADFRKGIDGLSRLCREVMGVDAFSGYVFVFHNRRKTAIKIFHLKSRHSHLQYILQFLLKEVFLY